MSTKMEPTESRDTAIVVAGLNRAQVALVKRTICKGYTDDEMRLYLYQAERLNLDPLSRQTYTFKSGGKVVIGTTIDGFRKRADGTGCYSPGRPTKYEYEDGQLVRATAYVEKFIPASGTWKEVSEEATYSEFKGPAPNWKTMPRVMLSKCAEARALRRAFPNELGGLYAREELDHMRGQPARSTQATRSMGMFKQEPAVIEVEAEVAQPTTAQERINAAVADAIEAGIPREVIVDEMQKAGVPVNDPDALTDEHAHNAEMVADGLISEMGG
jgi:phage recombination protein Bet